MAPQGARRQEGRSGKLRFLSFVEDMVTPRIAVLRAAVVALSVFAAAGFAPAHADELSAADEAVYARAYAAADRGAWDEALAAARAAKNPVLAKALTWRRMLEPRSGVSFTEISRFASDNPDWPLRTSLLRRAEEAIGLREDPTQIYAWFQDKEPVSADGWMALTQALDQLGRKDELVTAVRKAWREATFGSAQEKSFAARFGGYLTDADHLARLDRLLWDREAEAARRMLRVVDADNRALAQARIALIEDAGGVDVAVDRVPRHMVDDPGLVYERMRWRRSKGFHESAEELLAHKNADKVRPDLWWRERAILAREALEAGAHARAYKLIDGHEAQAGAALAEGEFMSGWIALRFLQQPQKALPHFERLYANVTTPISLSRGAYWAGRAHEAMGNKAEAEGWYMKGAEHGTAYYGQLAAAKLGEKWPQRLPADPQPTPEDIATFEKREIVRAAQGLAELGRADDAASFLYQLQAEGRTPGQKVLATRLAEAIGQRHTAVAMARRAAFDGVTLIESGYPIAQYNSAEGLEKALVLSIIRQESNFNSDAVSRVGARGLMQLMPATAKSEARRLSLDFSESRLNRDPAFNVTLGSHYLHSLIQDFRGSYVLAIAAYNAGPGRSRQWVQRYGDPRSPGVDPIDWVEMIPFSETRNYVQRVLEGVQVYRQRLGSGDIAFNIERDLVR